MPSEGLPRVAALLADPSKGTDGEDGREDGGAGAEQMECMLDVSMPGRGLLRPLGGHGLRRALIRSKLPGLGCDVLVDRGVTGLREAGRQGATAK